MAISRPDLRALANVRLREHNRYEGDGLGGIGALPIGDPASGVFNPSKSGLRDLFGEVGDAFDAPFGDVEQAVADAQAAQAAAEAAAGANLFAQNTRASAITASIPAPVQYVRTAGYATVGDGGGALYRRVSSEPANPAKFQSADGAWWELAERQVDVRMLGVVADNATDAQPALQAYIDYLKTLALPLYQSRGRKIVLPHGRIVIGASVDVTGAHGLVIEGQGRGATMLRGTGNFPVILSTDPAVLPLHYFEIKRLTIQGASRANVNGHGIRLGSNNNCIIDVRVWTCRRAISLRDSWQTRLMDIRVDGLGALACHDGLFMEEGTAGLQENAVIAMGGLVQGCERWGFRGECVTGSKFFGFEVLGCGQIGVYLGEAPNGKDLKWMTWAGGLIDTCPDLLVVKKGTAAVCELLHFSGMWMGYASDAAVGIAAEFVGCDRITFAPDLIVSCGTALAVTSCTGCTFDVPQITDYNRLDNGAQAIVCQNSERNTFRLGRIRVQAGSTATASFAEGGTSARNTVLGGWADGLISTTGTQSRTIGAAYDFGSGTRPAPDSLPRLSKANLPPASSFWTGRIVFVPDDVGGSTIAFCDGGGWVRVQDRVVVS